MCAEKLNQNKANSLKVYYDGDCPFCSSYMGYIHLKDAAGSVQLIDLRNASDKAQEFLAKGLNVDEGMIVDIDGNLYSGDQALVQMALLSTRSTRFNKMNYFLFKNAKIARILYPFLRFGRNCALTLLGKKKILE